MEKAKISGSQLFVLVTLFEMGSAILFGLGAEAKQDTWIAVSLGLILVYYSSSFTTVCLCFIRIFLLRVMFKK
ncbi:MULTISPECIES: GerAB/ArcD/ProY family transporter [unclassified Bacillus (in: firmicutes)]|uniref:GerAB/ArcD/ProY family transporter n=1 Tax=unclassified Bacillus (in: firmicutes) TaxID=185979 RepID=UPI0020360E97|nr:MULTISPECIES: GerAB/ArcD/ProY family transporter [unclassified Bacillus (in: firmicutes)]